MKGTLFSADFVKDNIGNLRLLEFNTDTGFTSGALHNTDFSDFISLLSSSNISEVHVIHKDLIHENFVSELSQSLSSTAFITHFQEYLEEQQTIYPTVVEDADNKFILRLAYDESAIFDSTYCKTKSELLKLFNDNSDSGSVSQFYLSSSVEVIDNLDRNVNTTHVPDVVVKSTSDIRTPLSFYKVSGDGTTSENFDSFISGIEEDTMIINYYNDPNETKHKSFRSFNIIYGSNLDIINLADVEVPAVFSKPTELSLEDGNKVNIKHFYEFASNFPEFRPNDGFGGIFQDETITDLDGNPVLVSSASIGDSYRSYYVEGAPDTDNANVFGEWSYDGSTPPSGSYITSSVLINSVPTLINRNIITHIHTEDSASFRVTGNQHIMVYDPNEDALRFKTSLNIQEGSDKLLKMDNTLTTVTNNDIEILDGEYYSYLLDFENVDTYILHESALNIKVVAHNACFPAGTQITLGDGSYKNIEEVQEGDTLLSYDTHNKEFTTGRVTKLSKSSQQDLLEIETQNEGVLWSTPGHKIYVNGKWIFAKDIREGDSLLDSNGNEVKVKSTTLHEGTNEVYHLVNVGSHNTYFANNLLVHNWSNAIQPDSGFTCFSAGTRITLSNHDEKFIEDIVVGDEVLGWDGEKLVHSKVTAIDHRHTVASHADACKSLGDEPSLYTINETGIEFTPEHPFLTKEGWKSIVPDPNQEPYKSQQEPKVLGLGDFIMVNGEWEEVKEVRVVRSNPDERVYNITVDGLHSYIADGIVVHNK